MKTVPVSRRAKGVTALLKQARRQNLILRDADGHEFILAELDDFSREIALARCNKRLMDLLDRRGRQTKTIPLSAAKAELGLG